MNMMPNDHHEAKTPELGAAVVDCIVAPKLESVSSIVGNVKNEDGTPSGKVSAADNNVGDTEHKDEKSSNLRTRRKSKYLSPPFTDPIKGKPSKESESPDDKSIQNGSGPALVKCSRKRKQPTKSIAILPPPANLETITASPAELLLQLHIVACDTSKPSYNKAFDPVKLFFNRFRVSAFCSLSIEEQKRADKRVSPKKDKTPVKKVKKEKDMPEPDKKPPGLCGIVLNFSSNPPLAVNDPQLGCSPISSIIKPQRKRKRKVEPIQNPGASETTQLPDLNCDTATTDPLHVTSEEKTKPEPEKKKRVSKETVTPTANMLSTPCLNVNSAEQISLEVCLQDSGPYACPASTGMNSIFGPEKEMDSTTDSNVVSPPGFCAKVSTPSKPTPPLKSEPVEKATAVIGHDTNSKSSSPLQNSQSSSGMSLDQMKQSLEFMTSMLEKSGDRISPVMRANLEKEIKNLLKKVDPMIRSPHK